MRIYSRFFIFPTLLLLNSALFADDQPVSNIDGKGPAFTSPPTEDPNYRLLGEFVGEISVEDEEEENESKEPKNEKQKSKKPKTKMLGLQIRPTGHDNFDALSFIGGLPGQETHNPEPLKLIGRRSGEFVILSGGPWAMFVDKDACTLINRKGKTVGRLERISRTSPTLGARPPQQAVVLFDGSNTDQFTSATMTKDGLLEQGAFVKPMFHDFNLHVEFCLPYMPEASGQSRGNSGLYLQSRYECQVLDSFATEPVFNGLGAIYRVQPPMLNMCFPPLTWQTYDIMFTAPRWAAGGEKIRDAHVTSWINGVKVQDDVALPSKTGHGKDEAPTLLPMQLQDHGDPVRYRNVWVIDRGLSNAEFPVYPTKEELQAAAKAEAEKIAAEAAAKQAEEEKLAAEKAAVEKMNAEQEAAKKAAEMKKEESQKNNEKPNRKKKNDESSADPDPQDGKS